MSTAAGAEPTVVGIDGSAASKVALDWAARDAAMRGVSLKLVHVLTSPGLSAFPEVPMPPGYLKWQQDESHRLLESARETAVQATGGTAIEISSEIVSGATVPTLVEASAAAGLLVVGCRGQGALRRGLLGSVSTGVVHHAMSPVAVIHDEDPLMPHPSKAPVVVGVDGSPVSEKALAIAFEQASFRGVDLLAVHAWSDSGIFEFPGADWSAQQQMGEEVLGERLSGWQERYPDVLVRRLVVPDRPADQLLEQGAAAQLLVVGSHGRGGFAGALLGSVSTTVVHGATMPVIVAR